MPHFWGITMCNLPTRFIASGPDQFRSVFCRSRSVLSVLVLVLVENEPRPVTPCRV